MNRRHHHTCRCNDCVRRRNAHRRRAEWRDLERGTPRPSGSTLYEVMRDLPPIYEDEVRQREEERNETWRIIEEAAQSEPESSLGEHEHEAKQRLAERQQQHEERRQQAEEPELADPNQQSPGGGQPREEADGQRWRRAQEQYLEAARQQREEEERRRQVRAASREAARRLREEEENLQIPEGPMPSDGEESDDGVVPTPTEPARRHPSPTQFLMPLIITLVLLVSIICIGVLAYLFLNASTEASTQDIAEPTPDLNATVEAAVALAITLMTPSPIAPPDDTELKDSESDVAAESQGDVRLVGTPAAATTIRPQGTERPAPTSVPAAIEDYVEWVRVPKVSDDGILSFRARVDEQSNFVAAGPDCGLANVSLIDNSDSASGSVIPRSMATQCGPHPFDWVSNQYYYFDNLLTVTVQVDPALAAHPGLELCLWTGGEADGENRLLDCEPVQQP